MKKIVAFLFGVILLIAVSWFSLSIIDYSLAAYSKLDVTLQTGLASAAAIIIVAIVTYFANKEIETKKAVEQAVRPKKLELYQEFVVFFLRVLGKEGIAKKPTEEEIMTFILGSNPRLITFASNAVIKKWGKLRTSMGTAEGTDNLFALEELLKEIRKDLGHSTRGLEKGDILRLFVNDIDEYLPNKLKSVEPKLKADS